MPPRRSRIARAVDHHVLTAIPENSEQDTDELVELISPASYSVNVARRGLTSPSLDSLSTFSGVGEFTGRLARFTGGSVLSLINDTATLLRLRTIRRELANLDKVPLEAQRLGRMMVDLKVVVEIKNSSSGIYRQCAELIKKVLMVPEIDQLQNGVNLFELCITIYELDEFENLQKSIISLLRRCCGNASSLNIVGDDRGRIYSLASLLFKIMRTPRRLCDVKILIDLLYILSSKSFTSYIIQENLQKELNSVVEDFIDIIRDWMFKNAEDHRNCFLYAALTHIHDNPSSFYQISKNDSSCALGLDGIVKCGTENFKYPMFESTESFPMFKVFHDLRSALHECRGFSGDRVKTLFASRQSRELLLSNGLKEELLAFLPDINGGAWRFGKTPNLRESLNAVELLYIMGERYLEEVIDHHLKASDVHSMPYLEAAVTTFIPVSFDTIHVLLSEEIHWQPGTVVEPQIAVVNGLSNDGQLTALSSSLRDILGDMRSRKIYRGVKKFHPQLAMTCLRLMNKKLQSNMLQLDDMLIQYEDMKIADLATRVERHIGKPLQYACRYWLYHVLEMNREDIDMIEKDIRVFFFEERHFLHWIEVMSATKQVEQAQTSLLLFYNWTKGNKKIEQGLSKLVSECYHLLRCFNEPIASGPLQVYVSAIPYLPPESSLYALYKEQATMSQKILFGQIEDIRLFLPELQLPDNRILAIAFSNNGTQIAFLFGTSLEIWDFATLSRISDPIALKFRFAYCSSVVFSRDGCTIAILSDGSIEIWDLIERRLIVSQTNSHEKAISFPDDAHLIYCSMQSNIIEVSEWTISEDTTVTYTLETRRTATCVALSSNAKYLGSISDTNEVTVWELRTREVISTFNLGGREGRFEVLAISNDEEHVACGSSKGTVKLWNFQTGSLVWTGKTDCAIKQILMPLSLDNKQMVTVSKYGSVHVWDMTSGSRYTHEFSAWDAALSPDGRHLVTSSYSKSRLWALEANKDEATLLPREKLEEVVFLNDGSLIAGGRGVKEGDIVVCDNFGTASTSRQTLEGHTYWIEGLRFSPDGKRLVSRDRDDNIILWSRDDDVRISFREKLKFDREEAYLMDAVPLTSGGILVAGSRFREKDIVVWDNFGSQNEQIQVLRCEEDVWDVRLTSDGRGLVSHDSKENVYLWRRDSDDVRFELRENRACSDCSECVEYFNQLAYNQSEDTPEDWQSPASQTQAGGRKDDTGEELKKGPFFTFDARSRWVGLVDGKKLWYIPEVFSGYDYEPNEFKFIQKGRKMVVYGPRFAILFEYQDDCARTS